jgi:hypothetical protein
LTRDLKNILIKAVLIFLTAFLFSCNQKNVKEIDTNSLKSLPKPKIEVRLVGAVRSWKSYADAQFMHDDKEIDAYIEKQTKGNPNVEIAFDSISKVLIRQFKKLGFIKNEEFLLYKFRKQTAENTIYLDSSGRKIKLIFFRSPTSEYFHFKLLFATDSVEVDTRATTMQDLDYAFLDIIPGGNKELVFLDDYYFMNGDHFDFEVYEIKIN